MSHYFAQKIKRSLEVFHYPPVQRLIRVAEKRRIRRGFWAGISLGLKISVVILLTFSLAGPSYLSAIEVSKTVEIPMVEEKDIVGRIILAIDVSPSMGFIDVSPSRLEAGKSQLIEFVRNSSEKVRFGIVAFDAEVKNSLSLTEDKEQVISALEELRPTEALPCLEEFTDIGYGLRTALNMLALETSANDTHAVILMSDGYANYGYPDPFSSISTAIEEALNKGVPVYTVHVARIGSASSTELLEWIAEDTHGRFMDSTSIEELQKVVDVLAKYYIPTKVWSTKVDIKTTIPQRMELAHILMYGVIIVILLLWIGNYKHYKTWF